MTIASQGSVLSFAVQADKVGRDGTFNAAALDWYKILAVEANLGTIQEQQTHPLELGGRITPRGAYKLAVFGAGESTLIPRIENIFGWLLKATMGDASSVTGKNADGVTTAGVNTHIFRFDPTDQAYQPWIAVRRVVPGRTPAENFGETVFDCKVNSLRFTIPAKGKVACRLVMLGRDVELDDAAAWVYDNAAFEDTDSTPDAGRGQFLIGGVEYPLIGAVIDIANGLSTPDQEAIIGDFRPDDYISLTRGSTVRIVYKYENSQLYRRLLTGSPTGNVWSSLPFMQETDGSGYAFDARFQAPANIPTTSTPYTLRVRANKIVWAVDGPIQLQAGGFVTQTFIGTVIDDDVNDYLQVTMENAATAY